MAETMTIEQNTKQPTLGDLVKPHVEAVQEYNMIEQQIEQLKKELGKFPYWKDSLIKPIAEEMIKHFPGRHYDILGPFGLSSEISIHFYKNGVDEKHRFEGDNCMSITFRPGDLDAGELRIVDHDTDTGEFRKGTLGELNGMNHPAVPLSSDTTIEELIKKVR